MDEYDWNPDNVTLEIFPPIINNDNGLIYHGTSALYSDALEENGFLTNHCPFPIPDLTELVAILADLNQPSDFDRGDPLQINFNEAGSIDHFLFHLGHHPISFTNNGFAALKYATGDSKGGQIVGKIYKAILKVREGINELPLENENRGELTGRLLGIQHIENMCEDIQNSPGVVYVINPPIYFYDNLRVDHKVIFSDQEIIPEMIVAKTVVELDYEIPEELLGAIKSKVDKQFAVPNSISNFLMRKYLTNDEEIDLNNF